MRASIFVALAAALAPAVYAGPYFTAPDDGKAPALKDFGDCSVGVYAGSAQQQSLIQNLAITNAQTASTVQFIPDPAAGEDSTAYFIKMISLNTADPTNAMYKATAYSAMFALKGMTGKFNSYTVQAQIAGTAASSTEVIPGGTSTTATSSTSSKISTTHTSTSSTATGTPASSNNAATNGARLYCCCCIPISVLVLIACMAEMNFATTNYILVLTSIQLEVINAGFAFEFRRKSINFLVQDCSLSFQSSKILFVVQLGLMYRHDGAAVGLEVLVAGNAESEATGIDGVKETSAVVGVPATYRIL
ncbi:Ser-Thr-rich glycosyl-phosphatidyl-inositol-anchored membrane family [Rhizoctonia solani]|uniref:Ser-Thr-rich glycosyl-phosphatidyl-inositol-anchored membrane family n=1 Tax=Rhizoctonia solani TaxID=456999 RepID=A0A8H7M349_9AGAM|nr:Ser-Thr-rich glycosyl-phosphatidyl-inositol-anchored membrane family [Rhizoctonia solani]